MEQAISALVLAMDRMGLFRCKLSCISDLYGGVEPLTRADVVVPMAPNPIPFRMGECQTEGIPVFPS